jgi:predicted MFS family arabinose efflux permease
MVNLNALAQATSRRRQGTANGLYRSVTATGSILGPLLATSAVAWTGSYTLVIFSAGAVLSLGMAAGRLYPAGPDVDPQPRAGGLRAEIGLMLHHLVQPLHERGYVAFLLITLIPIGILQVIAAFLAIRLTGELGVSETRVGLAFSLGGGLTLGINLMGGWLLDQVGPRAIFSTLFTCAGCLLSAIGLTGHPGLAWGCLLAMIPCLGFVMAPLSLWLSSLRGTCSDTVILSSHKLWFGLGAAGLAAGMGGFESVFGLGAMIATSGVLLLLSAASVWMLPAPNLTQGVPS